MEVGPRSKIGDLALPENDHFARMASILTIIEWTIAILMAKLIKRLKT
jgi:hypothetical protein